MQCNKRYKKKIPNNKKQLTTEMNQPKGKKKKNTQSL